MGSSRVDCCAIPAMSDQPLEAKTCVVTGASGGIGRAIAIALAQAGASIWAVARRRAELEHTAARANGAGDFVCHTADLTSERELQDLVRAVRARGDGVDVLVHCAGTWTYGMFGDASARDLDRAYATNVRAPYMLTQKLLPALRERRGQVVFINSSAGLMAKAGVAQYAATKHALKALADALREEVNPDGVRIVSVYPGRTATPMQAKVHAAEQRPYVPGRLMQPEDVASAVLHAITLPRSAEVTDLVIRPMLKS
jgi:short-subunit dehydrogenase